MKFFSFKCDNGAVLTFNLDKVGFVHFVPPVSGLKVNGQPSDGKLTVEYRAGRMGSELKLTGAEACRFHEAFQVALYQKGLMV